MKSHFVALLAGLCMGTLAACGSVTEEPQVNPQTGALECICPVSNGKSAMVRQPVQDSVTGMATCSCDAVCGDGYCDPNFEDSNSCQSDCGTTCGDGACNGSETCSSCSTDCGSCNVCGDGVCSGSETCSNCSSDCGVCDTCGDGYCSSDEVGWCTQDCCLEAPCPV